MFKQLLEKRELFIQYSGKKFKSFFTRFQGSESDSTDIYRLLLSDKRNADFFPHFIFSVV